MIFVLLATAGMASLAVYVFRTYVKQQVALAELIVHAEYRELVQGESSANDMKTLILVKYDDAVAQLMWAVK